MAGKVVSYVLRGEITQFQAAFRAASASVGKLADDLTGLDAKGSKARRGLATAGDAAGKFGLAAAGALGAVVVATANFEQAMSNVQAATHETAGNMDLLREAALKAGADTAFSASEAAAGIENLAKAGVSTQDILGGGLAGALDLAAAGGIEVGEAAEYAARAMSQFGLSGSEVPRVADLLSAAAGKAVGEVGDFGQALNQAGLVADQVGLSIEETTGGLAAFAQAGLQGSDAGTSLKTMLGSLTPNSEKAAKAMESLGLSAYDSQGNFIGLAEFAGKLQTALGGMSDEQRQATMETIFGSDAVRAAAVLYEEGESGIRNWIAAVDDQGYAAETAAIKLDNLRGDLEALGGSLETALIGAGEGSSGMLRGLVQGLTDTVNAFNDLSPAAKTATTAMLGVTAVTGGGLWFGSKVVQSVARTRQALADLGVQAETTGRLLKGGLNVAAMIGAIDLLGDAIDSLFDTQFARSNLDRSLEALAKGSVSGELLRLYGEDLSGFARDVDLAGQVLNVALTKIPIIGDTLSGPTGDAIENLEALDQALASLVESGRGEDAAAVFDALVSAAADAGVGIDQVRGYFEQYELAVANATDAMSAGDAVIGALTGAQSLLGQALGRAATEAENEAQALRESVDAMREKRAETIRAASAEINYEASLDDARKALKENGSTLDITTAKGRANKSALLDMAAAWNDQSAAIKNSSGARKTAIGEFVALATKMGMGREKARELARSLYEIPEKRSVDVNVNTGQATSELVRVQGLLNAIPRTVAVSIVAQRRGDWSGSGPGLASGGTVDGPRQPYGDKVLTMLAPGEEVISNRYGQADRHRDLLKAINAGRYADGGTVQRLAEGGTALPKDPERRADVLRLLIEIRGLRKDLAKTGKDALSGLERRRTEAELRATLRDLRETRGAGRAARRDALQERYDSIMAAMSGFDVSGALGRTNDPKNPTAAGVRSEIAEMRDALKEAGVAWSKGMRENARRMVRQARAIDVHERALERETKRREELTNTLAEQQQAMEQLKQAMGSFSSSVAGNFLPDTFKGAYTVTEPGRVDPALQGRLSAAEQRLIALRSSPTGDSVAAAAEASRLLPQIEAMRAEIEQQSQPVERTVSALEAMREELAKNAEDATAFAEALRSLSASGLDPALFAELAASGDLGLAQELVKGGPAAVEDINDLWNQRAAVAAEVAAFATQQVYGEQQAALQKQIDAQSKLISAADKTIKALEGEVKVLGDRVERGAERGVKHVERRLASIESAIKSLPRENRDNQRAGKGRG